MIQTHGSVTYVIPWTLASNNRESSVERNFSQFGEYWLCEKLRFWAMSDNFVVRLQTMHCQARESSWCVCLLMTATIGRLSNCKSNINPTLFYSRILSFGRYLHT